MTKENNHTLATFQLTGSVEGKVTIKDDRFIKELVERLNEANVKISFSKNCVSGFVGKKFCRCYRCTGVNPKDEESGWELVAKLIAIGGRKVLQDLHLRDPK